MRIAIVIPARNAEGLIGKTLQSIRSGSRQPDELFVVDGLSNDATAKIAQTFGASLLTNNKRHSAAARQLGVTTSNCEVIAFTDADCMVAPDWLERIEKHFSEHQDLDGVGGRVLLSEPMNIVQRYASNVFSSIMQFPTDPTFVVSRQMRGAFAESNCAYRKEAICKAGGYNDFFSNYAEGIDLFWRLIATHHHLLFDPALTVEHLGYPKTLVDLFRTHFRYGIASTKLAKVHIGRVQIDRMIYDHFSNALINVAKHPNSIERWCGVCQLTAFLCGKIFSSLRYGVLNL